MGGFQCSGNILFCIYCDTCQHNLCIDMQYIKSLQYVSAFQPSSDNCACAFTLSAFYIGQYLHVGVFCVVGHLYISVMPLYLS